MPQQASAETEVSSSNISEWYCSMKMAALPTKLYACIF